MNEDLDDMLLQHIQKNPAAAIKSAVETLQRAASLLDHEPDPVPANDQRLVAGIMVKARILYLYFNDSEGSVDDAVEAIVRRHCE